jgi:hypothetical protein
MPVITAKQQSINNQASRGATHRSLMTRCDLREMALV